MVLCASVPVIARDPAVCALVKAAMEVCASVETAASAIRAAVQNDLILPQLYQLCTPLE